ncbi:MAG: hypothetical protein DSZ24_03910 [Thermodesulfatator sp.]|nr:MAG: hypothetical protein DSZ24_03910 [Thermodesulfatator sp.]
MKRRDFLALLAAAGLEIVLTPKIEAREDPLIAHLELALQHEFGVILQYIQHLGKALAAGKDWEEVLEGIIRDEVFHAVHLSEMLKRRGQEPTLAVWPPQTFSSLKRCLQVDLEAEQGAISLYQKMLSLPYQSREKKWLARFLTAEKHHYQIFGTWLEEMRMPRVKRTLWRGLMG